MKEKKDIVKSIGAKLHAVKPDEKAAPEDKKDRHTKEVEAESVAYTAVSYTHLDVYKRQIQYTSINSSYWQQHFYAFGRPAY